MPTLAHILAPQLAQKQNEIKAELGPALLETKDPQEMAWVAAKDAEYQRFGATPEQRAQWAEYNRQKYMVFKAQQATPPQRGGIAIPQYAIYKEGDATPSKTSYMTASTGRPQQLEIGNPVSERQKSAAANSYLDAISALPGAFGMSPYAAQRFREYALGMQRSGGDAGLMAENEAALAQAQAATPMGKRTGKTITLPKGAIGISESGEAVDRKGKKLGFLNQDTMYRTLERRPTDIGLRETDMDAQKYLDQTYGEHLKELDANGGDKFPAGYFKGMTAAEKRDIQQGVAELRRTRKMVY